MKLTREILKKLPKTDLHVHLDGSLRIDSLIQLATERGVKLPSYTEAGLRELVFKDRYGSLNEYLEGFLYTGAVMQDAEALERIAFEFMEDNIKEGVRYVEVRFAPQLHLNRNMGWEDVILSINKGLRKARDQYNASQAIRSGAEPRYEYGLILCAMRFFNEHFSEYYQNFVNVHLHSPKKWVYSLATQELARALVKIKNETGVPIVGFDLAGQEHGYPAIDHKHGFQIAHSHFIKKTVHAGEAYGPESIFQAITDLHADRIGHGYYLFNTDMIKDPEITDRERYVNALTQYIADRRITIEVCLTSNLQTNPQLNDISQHQLRNMLDAKLSVTICTDNRTVSNTTVTDELKLMTDNFELTDRQLKNIIVYGFKRSFFPANYRIKREYVRQIIDYYEKVAAEAGIDKS